MSRISGGDSVTESPLDELFTESQPFLSASDRKAGLSHMIVIIYISIYYYALFIILHC